MNLGKESYRIGLQYAGNVFRKKNTIKDFLTDVLEEKL
jgi:hypothetical protein